MLLVAGSLAPLACGSILGIDDGTPALDGSVGDAQDSAYDVTSDVRSSDGGREAGGGDADADADATPCKDPTYCDMHCGNGSDKCNQTQMCNDNCSGSEVCSDASNQCVCQQLSGFCTGRCGQWTDNCDAGVTCMTPCDAGCADTGYCAGCTPNPNACGSAVCGTAFNGCAKVPCGPNGGNCPGQGQCDAGACCNPTLQSVACAGYCNGAMRPDNCGGTYTCDFTTYCAAFQVCDVNTCCTPNPDPCGGKCTGFASDGCGNNNIVCGPSECTNGTVCYMGSCCAPNPMSCMGVPCGGMGNCGQICNNNCNDGGKDGGLMEAGCEEAGAGCLGSFECCSGYCSNPNGTCSGSPCSNDAGTSCTLDTDCCYPNTCHFFDGGQGYCGP